MAKRVLQADGTYCYTDNCRVHDRSLVSSVGKEALVADIENSSRVHTRNFVVDAIASKLPAVTEIQQASVNVVHTLFSGKGFTSGDIAELLIKEAYGDRELSSEELNQVFDASYLIQNKLITDFTIKTNDEVVIRATGQRGHVMEGSSFMGGKVRVSTEDNMGDGYQWYEPKDVAKIMPDSTGLAREQISSASPDELINKKLTYELLDQETSVNTRNAQGIRKLSNEDALVVREELMDIAQRFDKGYTRDGMTKGRVARYIREEAAKDYSWLEEKDRRNVKNALYNILNYIQPTKTHD